MADTNFLNDFATLVENQLTDFDNEFPSCDVSAGSAVNVLASVSASPEWGLYKEIDTTAKGIFEDTCSEADLEHKGQIKGCPRESGESLSAFRARFLSFLRNPPSGVKESDYLDWADGTTAVHSAPAYTETAQDVKTYENGRGSGAGNIVIGSDRSAAHGGEEEPTAELLAAVTAKINAERPWGGGSWDFLVIGWTKNEVDIEIEVTGDCDIEKTETDIEAYMRTLFGRTLYVDQLKAIAINNGAETADVISPAANVVCDTGPTVYERIWPGTIAVAAV